jgi:hypothetical protein
MPVNHATVSWLTARGVMAEQNIEYKNPRRVMVIAQDIYSNRIKKAGHDPAFCL